MNRSDKLAVQDKLRQAERQRDFQRILAEQLRRLLDKRHPDGLGEDEVYVLNVKPMLPEGMVVPLAADLLKHGIMNSPNLKPRQVLVMKKEDVS